MTGDAASRRRPPGGSEPGEPAEPEALVRAARAAAAGTDAKTCLEQLLRELEPARADATMLLTKESRGAWALLLSAGAGRALVVGNALSGSVTALARLGFHVTVVDPDPARQAFGRVRDEHLTPGRVTRLRGGRALPLADGSVDVVVREDGGGPAPDERELLRVCGGELVLCADNRLAYKRSTGLRGAFRRVAPWTWLRRALWPAGADREQHTLRGYRRRLAARAPVRAFALYPDAREFSHVVSLDESLPRLTIGPRERANVAKVVGQALGLFPHLTPSYALLAGGRGPSRVRRVLDALAERLGEPAPELDHLVATRSNNALLLTAPAGETPERARATGPGAWAVHVPLSPAKADMLRVHQGFLEEVRARFPQVPVPEPLFLGEVEGVFLNVERRLPAWTAPHLTGDLAATARMFQDCSRLVGSMVVEPARPLDAASYEELLGARFELVARQCGDAGTAREVRTLAASTRERLVGLELPLVLYHADLRSKHVQCTPEGEVIGLLDWGASEPRMLPYVDLLHLVAHQRKQEEGCGAARTWHLVRDRTDLRPHERAALEDHAARVGMPQEACRALEAAYPLLVAGMAERNWDYSRPLWVKRQFGL